MTPTPVSSTTDTGSNCFPNETRIAIHQPNFLPRLSTIVKLAMSDTWVVLDDVQYAARDYQHRARIAPGHRPSQARWLSLSIHRPTGRSTLIRDAVITDRHRCSRRTYQLITEMFRGYQYWPPVRRIRDRVCDAIAATDRLGDVAVVSTKAILAELGWRGEVRYSSDLDASSNRTQRLLDLTAACQGRQYLCGTGGMSYIDRSLFDTAGITITPVTVPDGSHPVAIHTRRLSALWHLANYGATGIADLIQASRSRLTT